MTNQFTQLNNEENDYNDQSINLAFATDYKSPHIAYTPLEESKIPKISGDTLTNSFVQDSTLDEVLMPPISLLDRKFNNLSKINYRKAQRDIKYPMNPAFISDPKFSKLPPLEDLITFC